MLEIVKQTELQKLYSQIAHGDVEALRFILAWQSYCHSIDDIVDGDIKEHSQIVDTFFSAAGLYNSNYWLKNKESLYTLVALITSDYIDSNNPSTIQKDFLRSTGNNMLKAVAFLRGGYALLRELSPIINNLSYKEHHDLNGNSI